MDESNQSFAALLIFVARVCASLIGSGILCLQNLLTTSNVVSKETLCPGDMYIFRELFLNVHPRKYTLPERIERVESLFTKIVSGQ